MKLSIYQVDAFADKLFGGNPAAVIPIKKWLGTELMQQIAMENNLSETVFFVESEKKGVDYDIRWFTPELEIDLCGHATLGSAYIIFEILKQKKKKVVFDSKSGLLTVVKQKNDTGKFMGLMDFPSWPPERIDNYPPELLASLNDPSILGVYKYRDYLVEFEDENAIRLCQPNFTLMKKIKEKVIITAQGREVDFVSRFFAPTAGVDEDPVTGSAHSQLIPFWSYKLRKEKMIAKQLSKRGGTIYCEQKGERVSIGGNCVFYMKGEISLPK
jgi:predicted PhzF superfamily epimerase YddE/YHI9